MQENKYSWVGFCQEFATKLSAFKDDRKTLIDKVIHALQSINMPLPRLEENDILEDVDSLYQKPRKSGTDFYKASAYNSRQTMRNSS